MGRQKIKKAGPRDIGRKSDWKAADYGIDLSKKDGDYLKEKLAYSSRKSTGPREKIKKAGPRDIGRFDSYKAADYVDLKSLNQGDYLAEKLSTSTKNVNTKEDRKSRRKAGPRD